MGFRVNRKVKINLFKINSTYFVKCNILLFFTIITLSSCENKSTNKVVENEVVLQNIKYAKGFTIESYSDYKVITLKNAWKGENTNYKYVLYNEKKPVGYENSTFIKTPIKSIACMSLTHLAFIDALQQNNSVVALSGCDYVSNKEIIEKINTNVIKEIGQNQAINYEVLIESSPDFLMTYGIDESSNKNINKLHELGIPIVLNAEYMENHPLGKAEWIKFVGAFYNLDNEADKIFKEIEDEYLKLVEMASDQEKKPSVLVGMPWNGVWYLPGGNSYQAQFIKDAGANYLWADNNDVSSFSLAKEIIIEKALDADVWININSYNSIDELLIYDNKFSAFKAIKTKNIYNNNNALNEKGGNEYWESGVITPHLILKDLIHIFHPSLINHKSYYYKKIE